MAWASPQFSRSKVDKAGKTLVSLFDVPQLVEEVTRDEALAVINNWRASHRFPLQTFKMTLLGRAKEIDKNAFVAQRLKRLPAIAGKLKRESTMQLSQMHDIGGCRAVVKTVRGVDRLVEKYERGIAKNPGSRAEFIKKFDYISQPKADGYRSVHLVYKYRSVSPKHIDYNGLRIEIQIRSRFQHAWASAVETVDVCTGQALKQALRTNVADPRWRRFFALVSTAIAMMEKRPLVPETPSKVEEFTAEIKVLSQELKVETLLQGIGAVINLRRKGTYIYLLLLDSLRKFTEIIGYREDQVGQAIEDYIQEEKENLGDPNKQVVLASAQSLAGLRKAYPSYYLDTGAFLDLLHAITD